MKRIIAVILTVLFVTMPLVISASADKEIQGQSPRLTHAQRIQAHKTAAKQLKLKKAVNAGKHAPHYKAVQNP